MAWHKSQTKLQSTGPYLLLGQLSSQLLDGYPCFLRLEHGAHHVILQKLESFQSQIQSSFSDRQRFQKVSSYRILIVQISL